VTEIAWQLATLPSLSTSARDMLDTMQVPRLLRRRELWLPTAWGWALLLALAAGGSWLGLHALYDFLAPNEPLGRGLLVVEGWVDDTALEESARLWRAGGYTRLVTTGGPVERYASLLPFATYAEQAAEILRTLGVPDRDITVVPARISARDRTFASAVALREWIARSNFDAAAIDIVSEGPHARRTWRLYRMAFGDGIAIGIRSTMPDLYPPTAWWRSSAGTKDVLTEALAWAWVACCFHPPPRDSYRRKSELGQEFPADSASRVAARLHQQTRSLDASLAGLRSR
jgi:hypothetical protein